MDLFKLSAPQKLIESLDSYCENSASTVAGEMSVGGDADEAIMNAAANRIIQDIETLRTRIVRKGDEVFQYYSEYEYEEIPVMTFATVKEKTEFAEEQAKKRIGLYDGKLYRLFILKCEENSEMSMFIAINHIIGDAWGMYLLVREFSAYCEKLAAGEEPHTDLINYRNYLKKEAEYLGSKRYIKDKNFWISEFEDFEKQSMSIENSFETASKREVISFTEAETDNFNSLVSSLKTTSSNLMMAFIMLYLHITERNSDICIGSVMYNRPDNEDKNTVGMLVNTTAFRYKFEGDGSFSEYVKQLEKKNLATYMHQKFNYGELLQELPRQNQANGLYDISFNYQIIPNGTGRTGIKWYHCGNIDEMMVITFIHDGNRYSLSYDYKIDCLTENDIHNIHARIMKILEQTVANTDISLMSIEAVSEEERCIILNDFNKTTAEYPRDKTITELFEEQVKKTPHNTAVLFKDECLTYEELNRRANSLAYKLRELGVKPNDFVAIIADRSIEMICGIYGIIKSGGAYVPIDPSYPEDRIAFMLEDCAPKAVLKYTNENISLNKKIPVIDLKDAEVWECIYEDPEHVNKPNDLIYCIYTSGTTGKPKGVLNINSGLINRILWMNSRYPIGSNDTILQKTTFTFDVSVWEIIWWSIVGARVALLVPGGEKEPDTICRSIEKYQVTTLHFVPSMLSMFEEYVMNTKKAVPMLKSLKNVFASGEALKKVHVENFYKIAENGVLKAKLANFYGPTEASIDVTYYDCAIEDKSSVPIGKPINNTQIYIANGNRLCGIGVAGELCIAGDGLAWGYLNRPELTAEKFVDNPFGEGRMYRSGDLAKWMPDGNIEYLGRIDEQVKIRGFRIELGEIESRIREVENINDCAVIAREDASGDKAIFAYYTSDIEVSISDIRDRISESLPDYMVPSYMMQIGKIPVTKNGKLDRRALPNIEVKAVREYIAPRNEIEEKICNIFTEILNVEKVGIKDGFFELGGHSLKAAKLVNQIEAETGIRIKLKEVFSHSTPEQLAVFVTEGGRGKFIPIPKAEEKEFYALSSAQKRIYLIQQMYPDSVSYNMPSGLRITGEVDADRIRAAICKIIDRHEILRTRFVISDGEPVQKIEKESRFELEVEESDACTGELLKDFVKPFDLSKLPLMRAKLVKRANESLLLFDMHHIIGDGTSFAVFIREFNEIYNGGEPAQLTHQFKDYSEWMRTRDLSEGAAYWKSQFDDEIPVLNMPTDHPRPQEQSSEGDTVDTVIDGTASKKIAETVQRNGVTDHMLFLAALMVTLSKYSRQDDIIIGSPISGRTHKDTENMLGIFVNTLAMRGKPKAEKTFSEFLEEIKEECLKAYEYQEYPFEELIEAVNVKRVVSRNPLFDVLFTMQNTDEEKLRFGETVISAFEGEAITAKFDLSVDVVNREGKYYIKLEYCTALFTRETAKQIIEHYLDILDIIAKDINVRIGDIEMLSENERRIILNEFNHGCISECDKTIVDLFEEQAAETPDKTAVVFGDESLTYAELNGRANALAHRLRELGIQPDDCVPLITDRSLEMMIGIYGILKSGGAYVPVDPQYPKDRISFMINDCKAKAAVIYTDEMIPLTSGIVVVDMKDEHLWEYCHESLVHIVTPENLAYCIYTSGTTGKPKGVMIEHRSLTSYVIQFCEYFGINSSSVIMQQAYIGFDTSIEEIYPAHISGGKNVIISKEVLFDKVALERSIKDNGIDLISCSPLLIREMGFLPGTTVKTVISGGDSLNYSCIDFLDGIDVYNTYGPTEATVCASYYKVDLESRLNSIPIGKPIANARIYIMNGNSLCGIGVSGELCIAGNGIARGYLNRQELTEEKFVKDPFGDGRMYRSGDLARWLPDGNIEYLGRIDEQVKIRGFRIELGEIENRIRQISGVKDCAVIARDSENGENELYGYYTSDDEIETSLVRAALRDSLPEYMVPAYMMQIDRIPVTKNGKLDRAHLPQISGSSTKEAIMPRNEIEEKLLSIYKEVINVENISVSENFFDIGGNSLKLMQVFSKLGDIYPDTVKVVDLFANPSIEQLATFIEKKLSCEEKTEIMGIKLPNSFFGDYETESERIGREFSEELSTIIMEEFSECAFEFMTAAYILTLSKISGSENITVQCMNDKSGILYQITVNLSKINNFYDIIEIVKLSLGSEECGYSIKEYARSAYDEAGIVIPLIVNGGLKYEYTEQFDFSVGISFGNVIELAADSCNNSLEQSALSAILDAYTQIVKSVAEMIIQQ